MEKEIEKTNVMRVLDAAGVHYTPYAYSTDVTDGMTIAERLDQEPYSVFKTLVTRSDKGLKKRFRKSNRKRFLL